MATIAYVLLGAFAVLDVLLVLGASRLEHKQIKIRQEWLHPPEDDDVVSILRDDDPDGDCTR